MRFKLNPSSYRQRVSVEAVGEFLYACMNFGEKAVINALRSVNHDTKKALENFIITISCDKFDTSPDVLHKEEKRGHNQRICFSVIIFFMRKYISGSYKDIVQLLNIKNMPSSQVSKYFTYVASMKGLNLTEQHHLAIINEIDIQIKNFIQIQIKQQNGQEDQQTS
jgi:hypothetical protein